MVDNWIINATNDGWRLEPIYQNESVDSAAYLKKDGYVIHVIRRVPNQPQHTTKWETEMCGWGPDGLCINLPKVYSMDALNKALTHCDVCGKDNVETQRYSFAGRCCSNCIEGARKKHEYPGWCD